MTRMCLLNRLCLLTALGAGVGCGTGFDPPSEVKTLRVIGVQKDNPFPEPGERVTLTMLSYDGLVDPLDPEAPRTIEKKWYIGCTNPPSETYHTCFQALAAGEVQSGDHASFTIAPDILETLPPAKEGQPQVGRTYVFFSVCAGKTELEQPAQEGALPFVCRDENGDRLGQDSFMVGYTSLLTYAGRTEDGQPISNQNPIVSGFQVKGQAVPDFCVDAGCLESDPADAPPIDCTGDDPRCIPSCEDDGDPTCPKISLRPIVDPASAELDLATKTFFGREYQEQMWINYYVDRGSVRGDGVRLLNDATKGWNEEYATDFFAPREPGPVTVWAVVHDDRGGQSWVRSRLWITDPQADSAAD